MNFYSIVIPFYKNYSRLEILLDSLYNSFNKSCIKKNVQLIVVNDSPEYDLQQKLEKYQKLPISNYISINIISNSCNSGVATSRNIGRKRANGNFITFIDQDDFVSDNYFTVLFDRLSEEYDIHILNAYHIWETNQLKVPMYFIKPGFNLFNLLKTCNILTPGLIVFKNNFLDKEFFCYDNKYTGSDDWALYLNIVNDKKVKTSFIRECIFNYVTHNNNESKDRKKLIKSSLATITGFKSIRYNYIKKIKIFLLKNILLNYDSEGVKKSAKKLFNIFTILDKLLIININNLLYLIIKNYFMIINQCRFVMNRSKIPLFKSKKNY